MGNDKEENNQNNAQININTQEQTVFEMDLTFERSFLSNRLSYIKIITYLDGIIEIDLFQEAVKNLAIKHPFLRSRIIVREDGTAYITTSGGAFPKVVIAQGKSRLDVLNAIYREEKQLSNYETDPTSRFILIKGVNGNDVLVTYIHHVVSDGRATVFVTKHLLELIANPKMEVQILPPVSMTGSAPNDVKIPNILKSATNDINEKWRKEKVSFGIEDFMAVANKSLVDYPEEYIDYSLNKEETSKLRETSRDNGVSVNAVILAAAIMAKNSFDESKNLPNKTGFAVDVRSRLTKEAGESCSLLASALMINPRVKTGMGIWEIAKDIHAKTIEALKSNQKLFINRLMSSLMDPTFADAKYMMQRGSWEGTPYLKELGKNGEKIPVGTMLTNLGGLQIPQEYDGEYPIKLKDAVFYPPVGGDQIIELGAASLVGKLHIVSLATQNAANKELKKKIISKIREILLKSIRV